MADRERMTRDELRASVTLAAIFGLRMLGLFLILPVFAVHARGMPGGDSATLVGLAIGIYGLTQAVLQVVYGAASDRWGRKPVIVFGLLLLAAGSFIAASATTLEAIVVGRALQGAGAISAAITAFIADATRDSQRTKAMAMVGATIGLGFAISMVAAPPLYALIGIGQGAGVGGRTRHAVVLPVVLPVVMRQFGPAGVRVVSALIFPVNFPVVFPAFLLGGHGPGSLRGNPSL